MPGTSRRADASRCRRNESGSVARYLATGGYQLVVLSQYTDAVLSWGEPAGSHSHRPKSSLSPNSPRHTALKLRASSIGRRVRARGQQKLLCSGETPSGRETGAGEICSLRNIKTRKFPLRGPYIETAEPSCAHVRYRVLRQGRTDTCALAGERYRSKRI